MACVEGHHRYGPARMVFRPLNRCGKWVAGVSGVWGWGWWLGLGLAGVGWAVAAEHGVAGAGTGPRVAAASDEGRQAMRQFRLPAGWQVELIAAEPDLANPVAFAFDEQERLYVVEAHRLGEGVLDIRGRGGWPSEGFKRDLPAGRRTRLNEETLDADLANRTVEDRERMLRMYFAENIGRLEVQSDRVKRLVRGADGKVTGSTVFADGFAQVTDGLASGVLARDGEVWFANIPHLWKLKDRDGDGVAEGRESLHHGYGVRVGFLGHDLHGLIMGPDGRLYFTVGDRGASVVTREGGRLETPDTGAVFRCDPDGRNLEIYATGLRNPQELVFDVWGNLWTGDNNSDGGDQARWTYLVEGGDSGWHIGWQFIEWPQARGPWNAEGMWRPEVAVDVAHLIPPLANIGAGPSGVSYGYGTGLPAELAGRFFMVDFRGGPSGIWSIQVRPKGAGYEVAEAEQLIWNALPTDVEVGPDGGLYWTDWVEGWGKTGKGRIYRAYHPDAAGTPEALETRRLLKQDLAGETGETLRNWLGKPDLRVRQRAQFALVRRGEISWLREASVDGPTRFGRLHGIWGLGQLAATQPEAVVGLRALLADPDPEIRGQAARVLGDVRDAGSVGALTGMLSDAEARPRFFAAIALGRLAARASVPALLDMIRANANRDPYLRHAGVMGLVGTLDEGSLAALHTDGSSAVRVAAVVALRRMGSPRLADFLGDLDPVVVVETVRAIHDQTVDAAMPALVAQLGGGSGLPDMVCRRWLAACLRVGTRETAQALARFAAGSDGSEAMRIEALRHLGQWEQPSGRDPVTGLWRPFKAPVSGAAGEALAAVWAGLRVAPEGVLEEAIRAVGHLELEMGGVKEDLRRWVEDTRRGVRVRQAALRVLAESRDEGMAVVLAILAADPEESMRREALRWQARLGLGDPLTPIREALARGGLREKQTAMVSLGAVRGESSEAMLLSWLEKAEKGEVPGELQLELMEAARAHGGERVPQALARWEASRTKAGGGAAVSHLLTGGDALAGRKVFYERAEVQCLRCHRAGGEGGVVGPDLAGIGSRQTRQYLLDSILHPNATVAQGYESVMVETRDGREYAGTVQSDSAEELVLQTLNDGEVRLKPTEIQDRWKGLSSMPEGLAELLTPRELRDVVEFLVELK